jgi:hypothetical protein
MTVTATITFTTQMRRVLATFLQAFDVNGQHSPMAQFGNWIGPGSFLEFMPGPIVSTGSAAPGPGGTHFVSASFAHTDGASKLSMMHFLVGTQIMDPAPCQIVVFGGGGLNLINDNLTALISPQPIQAGTAGTLANSRCSIDTAAATYQVVSQHTVTVTIPVTYSPSFRGGKNAYAVAFGEDQLVTHWVQIGAINLQ